MRAVFGLHLPRRTLLISASFGTCSSKLYHNSTLLSIQMLDFLPHDPHPSILLEETHYAHVMSTRTAPSRGRKEVHHQPFSSYTRPSFSASNTWRYRTFMDTFHTKPAASAQSSTHSLNLQAGAVCIPLAGYRRSLRRFVQGIDCRLG